MTIASSSTEIPYAGDGVSTVFTVPFPFDTSADLKVLSTDDTSGAVTVLSTGFSVGGGGGATGTVTFTTAPASGVTITILDNPALTQPADYTANDAFPAETTETALDRQTRLSKRLYQLIQHCLRTDDGDPSDATEMLLPAVASRKGKYLAFDPTTGAPTLVAFSSTVGALSQSIIAALLWPQTQPEIDASVTPINYARFPSPWKDISRFVSDNTGTIDVAQGFRNAFAAERNIIIPDGKYRFDSQVNVNRSGITIEGSNQNSFTAGISQGGAVIILNAAAGAGAAALAWTGTGTQYQAVNIERLGFALKNGTLGQIGVRFSQCVGARLRSLVMEGLGTAGDDSTAIRLDGLVGPFGYTGDFDIEGCYLTNHLKAIDVQGVCTTVRILNNEMYGTGLGGVAGSICVNLASTAIGTQVMGNTIEQWHDGIINQGIGVRCGFNYFEGNTNNETHTHVSNLQAVSIGNFFIDGPAPVYPTSVGDQMMVFERNIAYVGGTYMEAGLGFRERSRTFNIGDFTTPSFSAGNFTSNSGTWTVAAQTTYEYTVIGHKLTLNFFIDGTAASAGSELRIAIPGGFTAGKRTEVPIHIFQNATYAFGVGVVQVADAFIRCYKDATISGSWTNGAAGVYGQIEFEIQ